MAPSCSWPPARRSSDLTPPSHYVTKRQLSLPILSSLSLLLLGAFNAASPPTAGAHVLNVFGKVMDMDDKTLDSVRVTVDQEGKVIDQLWADAKGRFAVTLDIGGFYGIEMLREGYILKRFIIDSRTDDPAQVITGPFTAEVNLRREEDLAFVDITELDLPYAMVAYDKKLHAFMVDEAYTAEMKKVEGALMLSSARAKKRQGQ